MCPLRDGTVNLSSELKITHLLTVLFLKVLTFFNTRPKTDKSVTVEELHEKNIEQHQDSQSVILWIVFLNTLKVITSSPTCHPALSP